MSQHNYPEFKENLFRRSVLTQEVFDICFRLAWDMGHAYGYQSVEDHFFDLENDFEVVYKLGYAEGERDAIST